MAQQTEVLIINLLLDDFDGEMRAMSEVLSQKKSTRKKVKTVKFQKIEDLSRKNLGEFAELCLVGHHLFRYQTTQSIIPLTERRVGGYDLHTIITIVSELILHSKIKKVKFYCCEFALSCLTEKKKRDRPNEKKKTWLLIRDLLGEGIKLVVERDFHFIEPLFQEGEPIVNEPETTEKDEKKENDGKNQETEPKQNDETQTEKKKRNDTKQDNKNKHKIKKKEAVDQYISSLEYVIYFISKKLEENYFYCPVVFEGLNAEGMGYIMKDGNRVLTRTFDGSFYGEAG